MLLSILQHTGQPPSTKDYLTPNVSSAEVEKPYSSHVLAVLSAGILLSFYVS